ncbi:MAG: hypothetical protein HYT27_01110 [Parcubacteria group bacterium]|nr:hypothetical protein [Parcubacteria group bacterium]
MKQTLNSKIEYRSQGKILEELQQLKAKVKILASLKRFEALAEEGRRFARQKGIKLDDVLRGD